MSTTTTSIYFLITLILISHTYGIHNFRKDTTLVETKNQISPEEQEATNRAIKFYPNFKFHEDEDYFPQSIETFPIDWTGVKMYDKTENVQFGDFKGTTYNANAPIYASYLKNSDGSFYLT